MAAPLGHKKYGGKVKGSKSPGSGPTPDIFKAKCKKLLDRYKLLDYVARVAAGEEKEIFITQVGERIDRPCDTKDRLKAVEMIKDWGYGKSVQTVSTPDLKDLEIHVVNYSQIENNSSV